MPPLPVTWQKNSQNNEWFDFLRLDLDSSYFSLGKKGVFIIWYTSPAGGRAIRVGSGVLADQLKALRTNPSIVQYSTNGPLKVSWVAVNGVLQESQMAGAEAFLYDLYKPLVGEKNPAPPINIGPLRK